MIPHLELPKPSFRAFALLAPLYVLTLSPAAQAQAQATDARIPDRTIAQPEGQEQLGRIAATPVGEIGQRQTIRDSATNIAPITRINNRIESRIESRLDTRLDRNYEAAPATTSAFATASARSRQATRIDPR